MNAKILYITRSPPLPVHIGGNQRTYLMYQALSRVGAVDLFLALAPTDLSDQQRTDIEAAFHLVGCVEPSHRVEHGLWRYLAKINRRMAERLADAFADRKLDYAADPKLQSALQRHLQAHKYRAAVVKGLSLAMKTGLPPNFPVILDVDDVEYEWYESQLADPAASYLRKAMAARRLVQLAKHLPHWYGRYSYVWVTKKTDISYPGLQGARVVGVPYYTADGKVPEVAPDSTAHRTILMVGSYYHRPNRDGLFWFVRHVWPAIRVARPDAKLRVVGGGMGDREVSVVRSAGAEVAGVVSSVAPEYAQSAFTIAPIWSGAGINVKVFESYLYGRPCVVTRFAYRGYEECLPKGAAVAVCDDADDFAAQCIALLDSLARRQDMVALGRPRVIDAFSFDRFAKVVVETLRDAEHHRRTRTA